MTTVQQASDHKSPDHKAPHHKERNVIVDTGCANLSSVKFAIERLGFEVTITDDINLIKNAGKVILPGVGTARHAMANIKAKGLVETLQSLTQPVLGFCLGMQLMAESSTEGKESSTEGKESSTEGKKSSTEGKQSSTEGKESSTEGKESSTEGKESSAKGKQSSTEGKQPSTKVPCLAMIPTEVSPLDAKENHLPHMGWNTLTSVSDHPVFTGINIGDYFYFVHSFAAPISEYTIASCDYGTQFSAAIAKDNFIGCQFHPERSGALGSKIIQNFLEM